MNAGDAAPPVVDEHVERAQSLHVMPPHARNEDGVARFQLGDLPGGKCFAKTRIAFEVGIGEIDHADGLPTGRRLERSGIQIEDLLRRKQRETAPADGAARDIVRCIVVAGGDRAIADPDARGASMPCAAKSRSLSARKPGRQASTSSEAT